MTPSRRTPGGFTLIELVVVLTLMGAMLFVALPKIGVPSVRDDSRHAVNWIIQNIEAGKARAIRENIPYVLHIGIDTGKLQVLAEAPQAGAGGEDAGADAPVRREAAETPEAAAFQLPETLRIADVQRPGGETRTTGEVSLRFSPAGYSDFARIHLRNDRGAYLSLVVQPFLPHVVYSESYVE